MKKSWLMLMLFTVCSGLLLAQRWYGGGEGGFIDETTKTAREVASHSTGTPTWSNPKGFEKDVFTFCPHPVFVGQRRAGHGGWFWRSFWRIWSPGADGIHGKRIRPTAISTCLIACSR